MILSAPAERYNRQDQVNFRTEVLRESEALRTDLPFRVLRASTTWDPPSIADGAVTAITVDVLGAKKGDPVSVGFTTPTAAANMILSGYVDVNDRVRVVLFNKNGAALDLGSGTVNVMVFQLR